MSNEKVVELTPEMVLKAKEPSNMNLEQDHMTVILDGETHRIDYSKMSAIDALLLRLATRATVQVFVDTASLFEEKKEDSKELK